MVHLCTQSKDSSFGGSREVKQDADRKIGGDFEWLESLKVIGNVNV